MDQFEKSKLNQVDGGTQRRIVQYVLEKADLDIPFMIDYIFEGYKKRKHEKTLAVEDKEIPTKLIKLYYELHPNEVEFNNMKRSFIKKYAKNESELEGVNDKDIHGQEEILGLGDMYEYMLTEEFDKYFSIYSLKDLHRKLFSHAPHPECAGVFRTRQAFLPGTGIELCEADRIYEKIHEVSGDADYLHEYSEFVKHGFDTTELLDYLDQCVELKVELIRIHPFSDGNGRTVRAFINKLMCDAGLPPIYVKSNERTEYHTAMNKALLDGDFSSIKAFYRYKVCDSIYELDIKDRLKYESMPKIEEIGVEMTELKPKEKTKKDDK